MFQKKTSGDIEYLERPSSNGPAMVLMHGIGSNAGSFNALLEHLPCDWRVVAWNAPGYGGSRPLASKWPLTSDYAVALKEFLDRLELKRILLVGHSLGALTATAFAAAHRERVERLLLGSPALGHGVPRGGALGVAAQSRIDDLTSLGPKAFAAARASRLVLEPEANPETLARVREGMGQVRLDGYPQAVRMLASGRLIDDAERLQVPTDVIVGAEDAVTPPESARRAYEAVRPSWRGSFTMVPGVGHAIYQQAPAEFGLALRTFAEPVC